MTINKLIKLLQALEAKHGKRVQVCAAARELLDYHNDTYSHVDVLSARYEVMNHVDGDGFTQYNRDGSEKTLSRIVLGINEHPESYYREQESCTKEGKGDE